MKKFGYILAGAAMLCLSAATPLAAQDPVIAKDFDMQRCVNLGNTMEAPKEGEWGPAATAWDFTNMKAAGFDTVRIPVRWSNAMGPGPDYAIDQTYMQRVEFLVNSALAEDLNVILNVHHFDGIFDDPAQHMEAFVMVWVQIATRFKGASGNLWFETLNEPHENLNGDLMRLSQQLSLDVIRTLHPDRIVILGGEEWSGWRTLDTNLETNDPNVVYTYHYYDPFPFTHYKASWVGDLADQRKKWGTAADKAELAEAAASVADYRTRMNRPVFMGEFGAYDALPNDQRVKWAKAVRTAFEDKDVPWCLWAYANTFPIYDKDKKKWDSDMLEALGMERK